MRHGSKREGYSGAGNGKNGTVPLWVAAGHRGWQTESRLCVPLRAMSAPHRCNYAFRRYLFEKPGADRGREQGLRAQCRQRLRGPFSFLPELRQQHLLRVRQIPRRMRNSGRYLRRSGLCVPDLLSLRGVDASLGQIAVRNRSFPESPTRDEPLIRLRFVAVHESAFGTKRTSRHAQPMSAFGGKADITQTRLNVRF